MLQNFGFKEGWIQALRAAGFEKRDPMFSLYENILPNPNLLAEPPQKLATVLPCVARTYLYS